MDVSWHYFNSKSLYVLLLGRCITEICLICICVTQLCTGSRVVNTWVLFLPVHRYARAGICCGISVCLCVTHVLRIKMYKHYVKILLHSDSTIILVFHHQGTLLNSDGFTPNGSTWENWTLLTNKSVILETVWDTVIIAIQVEHETISKLSNGGTFDDLEWPIPSFKVTL